MMTRLASQRGASFVELLTAVSLFAVTTVGLSPALLSTRKMAAMSKNRSIAAALAADKVEEIRAGGGQSGNDTRNADGTTGGIFTRTWSTIGTNYSGVAFVNEVQVTVSWPDRPVNQSLQLVTLVAQ